MTRGSTVANDRDGMLIRFGACIICGACIERATRLTIRNMAVILRILNAYLLLNNVFLVI